MSPSYLANDSRSLDSGQIGERLVERGRGAEEVGERLDARSGWTSLRTIAHRCLRMVHSVVLLGRTRRPCPTRRCWRGPASSSRWPSIARLRLCDQSRSS